MHRLVLLPHEAHAGENEEGAEHEQQPFEAVEEGHAGEDEDEPHEQRPEDAPEQHAVLELPGHGEIAEDQRPDEDVVDRQALLDEVAGVVLARRLAPVEAEHDEAEGEADADPHRRLEGGLLGPDGVGPPVEDKEVDEQEATDEREEADPGPPLDVDVSEIG